MFANVIQNSSRYANYMEFVHFNKILEDCDFLKIMVRDAIYIPVTYRKIVIWLGFRYRVFLDITTQQNQINKYQNIESKERIFQTETQR